MVLVLLGQVRTERSLLEGSRRTLGRSRKRPRESRAGESSAVVTSPASAALGGFNAPHRSSSSCRQTPSRPGRGFAPRAASCHRAQRGEARAPGMRPKAEGGGLDCGRTGATLRQGREGTTENGCKL